MYPKAHEPETRNFHIAPGIATVVALTSICLASFCYRPKLPVKTDSTPAAETTLPPPFQTKSATNYSMVIGWREGTTPVVPAGLTVTKFADNLEHPRWIYIADNGDAFVAESNTILKGIFKTGAKLSRKIKTQHYGESANRITMFRDTDNDGIFEKRFMFAKDLNQPFGMSVLKPLL